MKIFMKVIYAKFFAKRGRIRLKMVPWGHNAYRVYYSVEKKLGGYTEPDELSWLLPIPIKDKNGLG